MFFVKMADQIQEAQQTSSGEEAKTEENVRKQLKEFFHKISKDLRKCQLCKKLVRAPQGNQSSLIDIVITLVRIRNLRLRILKCDRNDIEINIKTQTGIT